MADVRQMRANLMCAPRHQLDLKPRVFSRFQHPIAGNDFKCPSGRIICHRDTGKLRVFPQIRMHDRFPFGRAALGSAGIKFFHRPLFKRFSSCLIGRVVLGQQEQTAGLYIQSMAKTNPVCFFALSPLLRHHAGQHAVPSKRVFLILRLNPLWLIDENDMLVLKNNRQGRLALPLRGDDFLWPINANLLSFPHPHVARYPNAVHAHVSVLHRLLDGPLRHVGHL